MNENYKWPFFANCIFIFYKTDFFAHDVKKYRLNLFLLSNKQPLHLFGIPEYSPHSAQGNKHVTWGREKGVGKGWNCVSLQIAQETFSR